MFDKLVESSKLTRNDNRKRKIFAVASATVLATAAAILLISLFDQALGMSGEFESLERLATPVVRDSAEPEVQKQDLRKPAAPANSIATRQKAVARIDTPVTNPPSKVSSDPYKGLTIPKGPFMIRNEDRDVERGTGGGESRGTGLTSSLGDPTGGKAEPREKPKDNLKPPPALADEKPRYIGPVNGKAVDLPKPAYPAAARQLGLKGTVKIEVLIDKDGTVLSAKAVDGSAILRGPSIEAAKRSRFSPTTIGGRAVQVRGIIVYIFQ